MEKSLELKEKLIIASNREPYIHDKEKNKITTKKAVGGLVTALDPLMQKNGGTWVAWGSGSADFIVCDAENKINVPKNHPSYTLKRVQLSDEEEELYYKGYANKVLWPLFHIFVEKISIQDAFWKTYCKVNQKFAEAIIDEIEYNTKIWIHDYHLSLVPRLIKEKIPTAKIAYFWHIPWPPWEIYGVLPQKDELLIGLLNADLIGFHTSSYVKNFINCCKRKGSITIIDKTVYYNNYETKIFSLPLGINYTSYAHHFNRNHILREKKRQLKNAHNVDTIILGIDRLDYTKGILNRLKAFEYFLEKHPEFRQHVVLIQIATPSRYEIEEYHKMKKNIDETVGRINAKFRTVDWTPVHYFFKKIPHNLLLMYYDISDIALLTPIRDGMNLIAKEFIATRQKPAVLILSEFAGASEELNEAIIVNPYDIHSTADAIKTAITMPKEEKENRFNELKKKVKNHNSSWWLQKYLMEWNKRYLENIEDNITAKII
jgi:trehalose 6-phosphate synthase/phosphatase